MHFKTAFRVFLMTLLTMSVSGCYETTTPILDKGEKSNIDGKYQCENQIDKSASEVYTYTEQKEGTWPFINYKYVDQNGSPTLLKKLPSGLFVAQISRRNKYEYMFVDFLNDNSYLVLVADLVGKKAYIEPLLEKVNIKTKQDNMSLNLTGEKKQIIDFFSAHDKTMMMVVLKCNKS